MRSLRTRLLVSLLGVFLLAWMIGFAGIIIYVKRDDTGLWDRTLSDVAQQVLLSLPKDLGRSSGESVPPLGLTHAHAGKGRDLHFQVWIKSSRQNVLRSPGAQEMPLKPDFVDGYLSKMIGGEHWRMYALSDIRNEVQVQVGSRGKELRAEARRWIGIGVISTVIILIALVGAMKFVIRSSLRSLVNIQQAMTARPALDLAPLPSSDLPDEVRPLVVSFNQLLERVKRAVENERHFLAEAAHELRTPLAAILTHAEVALRSRQLDEAKATLQELLRSAERSARLSQQLLDSARLDAEHPASEQKPVELAAIVSVVTHEFEAMVRSKRQSIALHTEPCPIRGNVNELGILIGNLLDNALRYSPVGARVAVRCLREGERVRLQVLDEGPGVPAADQPRIFDKFYRVTGNNERGSGIGLSLVARIATLHSAEIETGCGLDGRGFGISVFFPLACNEPQASAMAAREVVACRQPLSRATLLLRTCH